MPTDRVNDPRMPSLVSVIAALRAGRSGRQSRREADRLVRHHVVTSEAWPSGLPPWAIRIKSLLEPLGQIDDRGPRLVLVLALAESDTACRRARRRPRAGVSRTSRAFWPTARPAERRHKRRCLGSPAAREARSARPSALAFEPAPGEPAAPAVVDRCVEVQPGRRIDRAAFRPAHRPGRSRDTRRRC